MCKGFWTSDGFLGTAKDYSRLIVTSYDGVTGQIDTALLARFQQGLKQHYKISVCIEPTHAPIYCLPAGVETRLSVGDPGSNMSTSISALQPLLRLRNAQELHLKGNSRKFGFLLLWSTIKGARLNLEDEKNQLEASASVGGSGSDALACEVHSKLGKMKRSLADIKTQQEELGKKQDNLSSAVEEARDLMGSMKDDLESLKKGAKPAPVTAPAAACLWPGVQPGMAQSMELALAQNTQNAHNAMQEGTAMCTLLTALCIPAVCHWDNIYVPLHAPIFEMLGAPNIGCPLGIFTFKTGRKPVNEQGREHGDVDRGG